MGPNGFNTEKNDCMIMYFAKYWPDIKGKLADRTFHIDYKDVV